MRGKSILALAVALAMIFSVIPSLGLTASAADVELTDAYLQELVQKAPTVVDYSGSHNYNDSDIASAWQWTPRVQYQVKMNLRTYNGHDTFQIYNAENNDIWYNGKNIETSEQVRTATANKDFIVVEFLAHNTVAADQEYIVSLYSADPPETNEHRDRPAKESQLLEFTASAGGIKPALKAGQYSDENYSKDNSAIPEGLFGEAFAVGAENFAPVRAYIAKNSKGTYTVIWTALENGAWVTKSTVEGLPAENVAGGFKTMRVYFRGNNYSHIGFADLKIYAGMYDDIANRNLVKVTYKIGEEVVDTYEGIYDSRVARGAEAPEKYLLYKGEVYHADALTSDKDTEVEMTLVKHYSSAEVDGEITLSDGKTVIVKGDSIVVNGDFKAGTLGWTRRDAAEVNGVTVSYDEGKKTNVMTGKMNGAGAESIGQIWPLEAGKTYYIAFDVKGTSTYSSLNTAANAEDARNASKGDIAQDGGNDLIKDWAPSTSEWHKYEVIHKADEDSDYLALSFSWADSLSLANVEILPVEYKPMEVTGTYKIDGEPHGEPVKGTYNPNEGEKGFLVPEKYEYYNNKVYRFPETLLDVSKDINGEVYTYKSNEDGVPFYVASADAMYKYADGAESVVVNGDLATGAAEPWLNRQGTAFTGKVTDEEIDGVSAKALNLAAQGSGDPATLGQIWELEEGKTYYIAFDIKGLKKSSGDMYASLAPAADADAARSAILGNISKDEDDILKDKWTESDDWTRYEAIYTATADKPFIFLSFSWTASKLANVEIVEVEAQEGEKLDATVTVKDAEGTELGTYKPEAQYYEGQTITVPAGLYKGTTGYWYLDDPTETTTVTAEGKAEVTAAPLTAFTWEASSNQVLSDNKTDGGDSKTHTYNSARIVFWKNGIPQNRTGYVFTKAAESFDPATQNMVMNVTLYYGNGTDASNVPGAKFSFFKAEALNDIDLTKADGDTTAALKAVPAEEILTVNLEDYAAEQQATISIPIDPEVAAKLADGSDIVIKMHEADEENVGIAFVYDVQIETLSKEIEVSYQTPEGDEIGTEKVLPNEQGKLDIAARNFVFNGKFYTVAEAELDVTDENVVTATAVESKNAATKMENTVGGNLNLNGYNVGVAGTNNADMPEKDADGTPLYNAAVSVFGTERQAALTFVKPEAKDNQIIKLYLPVGTAKQNSTNRGDGEFRLVAKTDAGEVYSANVLTDTEANNGAKPYDEPVVLEFDVTEILKSVEAGNEVVVTLVTRSGGAGFVDLEMAKFGGAKEGIAPYLAVEDGVKVTVDGAEEDALITRNGNAETAAEFYAQEGDTVRVYKGATAESGLATALTDEGEKDAVIEIGAEAETIVIKSNLGVTLLDGAQVRIGATVDGEIAADSGLRFIGVVDTNGTIAGQEGAKISVDITAEESDVVVNIPITLYQDGEDTIFTATLTNLNPNNYNRKFTATPVVTIGEEKYVDENASVTRSIYEVAAGILVNGVDENSAVGDKEYDLDDTLKAVLNAYVNAVGVRFGWNATGLPEGDSSTQYYAFGGEKKTVFFDVEAKAGENGDYTVTITPKTNVKIDTDKLLDTIRINNNNSKVAKAITNINTDEATGAVTFTFNPTKAAAAE